MNKTWRFEDIVDLDYFCRLDRLEKQSTEMDLHQRDRHFFLEARKLGELRTISHHQCLRFWLQHRRRFADDGAQHHTPGSTLDNLLWAGSLLLLLLGGVLGIGAGLSYFAYTGQTPLNVFIFFTIFILPQLLFILLIVLRPVLLRLANNDFPPLLRALAAPLKKAAERRLRATDSTVETVGGKALTSLFVEKTGNLLKWPLFKATQLFAVAFNIGLAAVTLFKIATSDLAFGWQTTLDIGAGSLHSLVQTLAFPWSWLVAESLSHPTLQQIEGSRIILKEGIYHLTTTDLTSWWPFLLFCLLFYGLLPRLILLLAGFIMYRRSMERYLRQRKFYAISRRMLTPLVSTQAEPEENRRDNRPSTAETPEKPADSQPISVREALILIPVDLCDDNTLASLKEYLMPQGFRVSESKAIFRSYEEDRSLLEEMTDVDKAVVVVFEAWMAPIREQLSFLEKLACRLRQEASLGICLVGRPGPDRPFVSPQPQEYLLWRRKIDECCTGISFLTTPDSAGAKEP